jgi:valyl-tRNA synthetase
MFFINKLWNASRFVSANVNLEIILNIDIDSLENELVENYDNLEFHEKWILSRLSYIFDLVTDSMKKYEFSEA